MRVPLSWLEEWIPLPPVDELVERLTAGGLEVDSVEHAGPDLSSLRVGRVLERSDHPNADRLALCRVELGDEEPVDIVCGAPNVAAGQKVAVAVPGSVLPDGTRVKKSKIRGVTSLGMICSTRELGIGEEHDGILVLDDSAPVGESLDRVLRAGDPVLEIAITPNRGDCTSILGIAREVRAHFGGDIGVPECAPSEQDPPTAGQIRIEVDDPAGCHRYVARIVRGVAVAESPRWLKERLEAMELRPINNVVDATNLVMIEFGQPLHAFDLAELRGGLVRVRAAEAGEQFESLDGQTRSLEPDDLVIADGERAIGLAGVMGGANSEVSGKTRDLLIESAHFQPSRIRRTAKRLGISSDASYRFERGIDSAGLERAADRAARLIAELSGGQVATGLVEACGSKPPHVDEIALDPAHPNRLLGTDLSESAVCSLLERLALSSRKGSDGALHVAIPSYRNDLSLPEDLIEEVARMHGYEQIPSSLQQGPLIDAVLPRGWIQTHRVRDALRAEGLVEVASFPFLDPRDLDRLQLESDDPRRDTLAVLNPIADSDSQLRSCLLPSLLRLTRENLNRQVDRVGLFEVSRVFRKVKRGELPEERLFASVVMTRGEERGMWEAPDRVPFFFEAKGSAERIMAALELPVTLRSGSAQPYHHPGAAASILAGRQVVGEVGDLHPEVAAQFGIDVACAVIEMDLTSVAGIPWSPARYQEVSRHPQVRRDLAVLVDLDQPAGEILEAIRKRAGAQLVSAQIFDRYEGVADGKVSLAFRLVFQHPERTLTDAEVSKAVDRVVQMLGKRFGGELR